MWTPEALSKKIQEQMLIMSKASSQNRIARKVLAFFLLHLSIGYLDVSANNYTAYINSPAAQQYDRYLTSRNGDIFWAPASGFTGNDTWPNIFGDEVRSVFGSIPEISCYGDVQMSLHLEVEGNHTRLSETRDGGFRFESHIMASGVLEGSQETRRCDKPSLANTDGHLCGASSRISLKKSPASPNVDWVTLCRKSERSNKLTSDDGYWHSNNPEFALLGVIGFNRKSGEVVFIDGREPPRGKTPLRTFSWKHAYPPPGGWGYQDTGGRSLAYKTYKYRKRIACENCHDNKEPWIITPHLKIRGFGYRDSDREDHLAQDNILPLVQPRPDTAPYRVIGTRYTRKAKLSGKTFRDPTGSCTSCHTLTTGWTGKVLAYDAVGKINNGEQFRDVFRRIHDSRTTWAKQDKNTAPWMVPWLGPNIKTDPGTGEAPSEMDDRNWRRIAACINENSNEDCEYQRIFTACPPPESDQTACSTEDLAYNACSRLADPYGPSEISITTSSLPHAGLKKTDYSTESIASWSYLNGLGGVPQRDDVRFNLAIREIDIPASRTPPARHDYPALQTTFDPLQNDSMLEGSIHYCDVSFVRKRTCHVLAPGEGNFVINNISFAGHVRNSTPAPADSPRNYAVAFPTQCNKRYLLRLVPKRFCFDRSGVLASDRDHLQYFDVRCDAQGNPETGKITGALSEH